jgi:hypothetical protein
MSKKAKAIIEPLYQELLRREKSNGVDDSKALLQEFMEQHRYHKQSDNEILHNIQY